MVEDEKCANYKIQNPCTRMFGDLIKSVLSCDNNGEKLCKRLREYTAHSDVKEQTINAMLATLKDESVTKDPNFR